MKFVHTNIVTKNWKALAKFYIDVFGSKRKPPERKHSGSWLDKGTGLQCAKVEGVHLILPGYSDNGPTLEIFTYPTMPESEPLMANSIGINHLAFEVEDVERTLNEAIKNGGRLLGEITEKTIDGVGKLKFVYFRDPDGNIVEIQSWEK